ncbi:helix-turn-helix domain-containing protein [Streptomonospora nanhaiensis]|uniref:Helix-turn-helix domain-containing protein n=1 Tax=Streptomonospora nanhaiensis TaxID=1323731 RepID=A0ABY6YWC3_9ACTN|nr:helix-turn-helix domain-containing protein [Streptomonospora nanhaiensis]WAE76569.1 helix-turn-helix domain-containing protein [Streptomonospora nanhaiensis]
MVAADEDTVRDVIHRFNRIGLDCLDPNWAGGESPPTHPRPGRTRRPDGHHPPHRTRQTLHPLVDPKTRRPPAPGPRPTTTHQP